MNDKKDSLPPRASDPVDPLCKDQEPREEDEAKEEEGLFEIILAQEAHPIEPFMLGLLVAGIILAGTAFFVTQNTIMFLSGVLLMAIPYIYVIRLKARAREQRELEEEHRDE
jgi:hypothetical protein